MKNLYPKSASSNPEISNQNRIGTKENFWPVTKFISMLSMVFILSVTFTQDGWGQIYSYTTNSSGVPNSIATHATGSNLTRGSGVALGGSCGATDGFVSNGWPNIAPNITTSNTNGDYVQFTIAPSSGYALNITGFTASLRRNATTGPANIRYAYSLDGSSWTENGTNLAPATNTSCTNAGTDQAWASYTPVFATGTITYRIYGFNATSTASLLALRTITVSGAVTTLSNTQVFASNTIFQVPSGITCVTVKAWGGGGGGANVSTNNFGGGGGGGGGAFASSQLTVTPGNMYPIVVGTGGTGSTSGGNSTFNTTAVVAAGGGGASVNNHSGASGGTTGASTGTTKHAGGTGGTGITTGGSGYSGGGGGGAGTSNNGGNGTGSVAGTGGATDGGNGATGLINNTGGNGTTGNTFGGGGSGSYANNSTNRTGGSGASGKVVVSWYSGVAPDVPTVTSSPEPFCMSGDNVTLLISGNLHGAEYWAIYTGSCGGSLVGTTTSASYVVNPSGNTTYYVRGEGSCYTPGSCGSVSVTLNTSGPDCTNPVSPFDMQTGVSINTNLEFATGNCATGYKVYFGTDNPPTNIENGLDIGNNLSYDPTGSLSINTTYYWKIVPYNTNGDATGCDVWSFTTNDGSPGCASIIHPTDGQIDYPTYFHLYWNAATDATSYKLYLGTNTTWNIINGTNIGNVLTYDPGALSVATTYYWKVVAHNAFGDAINCDTLTFTTWDQLCQNYSNPTYCTSCSTCPEPVNDNPDLMATCGDLKIVLILDESGSIGAAQADSIRAAANSFTEILSCTGAKLAVIEFRGDSRYVFLESLNNGGYLPVDNDVVDAMANYTSAGPYNNPLLAYTGGAPAGYTPGTGGASGTNYMSPFLAVDALNETPDLIIFVTDGAPSETYTSNFIYSNTSTSCSANDSATINNPAKVANKLKCEGAHIFAYGVTGATAFPLKEVTGSDVFTGAPGQTIGNSDYVIGSFYGITEGISNFVSQLCPFDAQVNSSDICPNQSTGQVSIDIPANLLPYNYTLYLDPGYTVVGSPGIGITTTPLVLTGLAVGNYRLQVEVTVAGSGCTRTEITYFEIVAGAVEVEASVTNTVDPTCEDMEGGSATLNITAGESPYMITLKKAGVTEPGYPIMQAGTSYVGTGLDAGSYTFETKDANLCNTDIDAFTINAPQDCCLAICPDDVTVECGDSTDPADTGSPTNTAGCGTITYADVTVGGDCPVIQVITRTWTSSTIGVICTQTISVEDHTSPMGTCPPGMNYGNVCAANAPAAPSEVSVAAAYTDNCGTVTATLVSSVLTGDNCGWTHTHTYTISDGCPANNITCIIVDTGADTESPSLSCPSSPQNRTSLMGTCNYTASGGEFDPVVSDNCGTPTITNDFDNSNSLDGSVFPVGSTTVTWTATDGCGNTATCSFTIIVSDMTPPIAICHDLTIALGVDGVETITPAQVDNGSNDACGIQSLDLDVSTFDCFDVGQTNVVTLTVTDVNGNTSTCTSTVTVTDNVPPIAVCQDVTIQLDANGMASTTGVIVNVNDECGIVSEVLSQTDFTCTDIGQNLVTLTVTDVGGNTSTCTATVTVQDNVPPTITCAADAMRNTDAGLCTYQTIGTEFDPTATDDNCLVASVSNNYNNLASLAGAIFPLGTTQVIWTVTDASGNTATCSFTIVVSDITPPIAICHDVTVALGVDGVETITPAQVDNGSTDACGIQSLDLDVSTFDCFDVGQTNVVTLTVTDVNGNTSTCTSTVTVTDNVPPVAVCQDVTIQLDANGMASTTGVIVNVNDECGIVSEVLSQTDFTCTDIGQNLVTLTVTDVGGNTSTCTATVTVQDNVPPTITCAADATRNTNAGLCTYQTIGTEFDPTATDDNCLVASVSNNYNNVASLAGAIFPLGATQVIWTVTDASGNTATCQMVVTVVDNQPPTITCPADLVIECGSPDYVGQINAWVVTATATDVCDASVTITTDYDGSSVPLLSCDHMSGLSITFTATDDAGNTSQCMKTVYLEDNTMPTINCPDDLTIECGSENYITQVNDWIATATATDGCDGSVTISTDFDPLSDFVVSCDASPGILVVFTATDDCGNTATCSKSVYVVDTQDPYFTNCPIDPIPLGCNPNPLPDGADAIALVGPMDNCNLTPVTATPGVITGSCSKSQTWTVTATDGCGNTAECQVTYTWSSDLNPPTIATPEGADVNINCNPTAQDIEDAFVPPVFTDDCGIPTVTMNTVHNGAECSQSETRTWTATDGCGNTATTSQEVSYTVDTQDPLLTCPGSLTAECSIDEQPAYADYAAFMAAGGSGSDNCGLNEASFTLLNETSDNNTCPEIVIRVYQITDQCGHLATCAQTITIADDIEPTASNPAAINVQCFAAIPDPDVTVVTDAMDNCTAVPTVMFVSDTNNGGAGCPSDPYVVTRTYNVADACGNNINVIQTITVTDTHGPVLSGVPADAAADCGSVPTAAVVTASDDCSGVNGDGVVETETTTAGSCDGNYILHRTWTATDNCGNTTSQTQNITVTDTHGPVLSGVPADAAADCGSVPTAAVVTASDDCSGVNGDGVVETETTTAGSCDGNYILHRTWTATDNCGNTTSQTQNITVTDTHGPVLSGVPADAAADCGSVPTAAVVTASDDCSGVNGDGVVETETTTAGSCDGNYILHRTWTATDNCGNTTSQTQNITVTDTHGPVLSGVPADAAADCGSVPTAAVVTASDDCSGVNGDGVVETETTTAGSCDGNYILHRTWTATDNCGNTTSQTQNITVTDTHGPVLSGVPADAAADCGSVPTAAVVTASDDCSGVNGDGVVETETTTAGSCDGNYILHRTWTATDNCGNTTSQTQNITVTDTHGPVLSGVPADAAADCGSVPTAAVVTASDDCSGVNGDGVVETETTTAGSCDGNYILHRTWTATDNCGNTTSQTQNITVTDTHGPVLSGVPADAAADCGSVPTAAVVTASDDCSGVNGDGVVETETTTAGSCDGNYILHRTWTATDNCGNTTSQTQNITVTDTHGPVLSGVPADAAADCGSVPTAAVVTASDDCSGVNGDGVVETETTTAGSCDGNYILHRTWTATDNCGNTTSQTQNITVTDTHGPVLSGVPADAAADCGSVPTAAVVTASDDCSGVNGDGVVETETTTAGSCDGNYILHRTWTATDNCGNTTSQTQNITVTDTHGPVLSGVPADAAADCGSVPTAAVVTASDDCSGVNGDGVVETETTTAGSCDGNYILHRTWTATDNCGNTTSQTQNITVTDTHGPVLSGVPADAAADCGSVPTAAVVTASDDCSGVNGDGVVETETTTAGSCDGNYILHRTWTATDNCGNTTSQTQNITVTDTHGPVLSGVPADAAADCGSVPTAAVVTASDDCSGVNGDGVVETETTTAGSCDGNYILHRTWTATDNCGNTTSQTQNITVTDTHGPVLSGVPADAAADCGSVPTAAVVTASDDCSGVNGDGVVETETTTAGSCDGNYILHRTWTATDNCGNTTSQTQNITVTDTHGPVLSGVPADAAADCGSVPTAAVVTASDDCSGVNGDGVVETETTTAGSCDGNYILHRTWTATDNCGNTTSQTQNITVTDIHGPDCQEFLRMQQQTVEVYRQQQ